MTYDNQPWKIMGSLKSVIAVAFGSGAYGMIFPTLWMISYNYSPWRLGLLSILAILGLGLWIIQGHDLWETETITSDNRSEEHTSKLQSRDHLICRLLLEYNS